MTPEAFAAIAPQHNPALADPTCSPETLADEWGDPNTPQVVKLAIAQHAHCPPNILTEAASPDSTPWIRRASLANFACPADTLTAAATNTQLASADRIAALSNPNCPPNILHTVATTEPDAALLKAVARNVAVPPDTMRAILETPHTFEVTLTGLANPSCPPDVLWTWLKRGFYPAHVAQQNPNVHSIFTLPAVASELAGTSTQLQTFVATHPKTPPDLLVNLSWETNRDLANIVAAHPACPRELALLATLAH